MYSLIITIISIFIAFYSGFYFGHLKREGEPPKALPVVDNVKNVAEKISKAIESKGKKKHEEIPKSFFE